MIFAYPLQLTSLVLIFVFSGFFFFVASVDAYFVSVSDSDLMLLFRFFLVPISFISVSIFLSYALIVLDRCMQGEQKAPLLSGKQGAFTENLQLLRVVTVIIAIGLTTHLSKQYLGDVFAFLILFFLCLIFPALLINIVRFERLGPTLNLENLIFVFKCLAWSYLLVSVIFYLCFFVLYWVFVYQRENFLFVLFASYWLILCFAASGLIMNRFAKNLEIEITSEEEPEPEDVFDEEKVAKKISERLYKLCRAREFEQAAIYLEAKLAEDRWKMDARIHEDLKSSYYTGLYDLHARKYVGRLLKARKVGKAWQVCEYSLKNNNSFFLDNGDDMLKIAELPLDKNQKVLQKQLVSRFINSYPEHHLLSRLNHFLHED